MERREWKVVKTISDRPTSDVVLVFDKDDNGLRLPWHREKLLKTIAWYANGYPKAARALNSYKRQHTALVEQRDRLAQAIRDLRYRHRRIAEKSGFRDCACDDCCYLAPHLNAIDAALAPGDEALAKGGSEDLRSD